MSCFREVRDVLMRAYMFGNVFALIFCEAAILCKINSTEISIVIAERCNHVLSYDFLLSFVTET